jgi:hypothetical protein
MDKILELQSEIYIKINSLNEPYRFSSYISFIPTFKNTKSKKKKKKFQKTEKIIQQ